MEPLTVLARAYGLGKDTLRDYFLAGKVRGQYRPGRGRNGKTLWLRVEDVDGIWGGAFKPGAAR